MKKRGEEVERVIHTKKNFKDNTKKVIILAFVFDSCH